MNRSQIIAISGAVLLTVLLLFANTRIPAAKKPVAETGRASHEGHELESLVEGAEKKLSGETAALLKKQKEALRAGPTIAAYQALVSLLDSARSPVAAAFYASKAAALSGHADAWFDAGNRFYAATRFVEEHDKPALFGKAIASFEEVLRIEPGHTEAKISLGACYVEGSPDPMKGIGILREVEKTDSNNINLQLNLAFFSEKSGQWDKAIARFEKVLKIQPDFIEAYLHLADAYQQKGDTKKTIENLEAYVEKVDDATIKTEVQNYINQLKTN